MRALSSHILKSYGRYLAISTALLGVGIIGVITYGIWSTKLQPKVVIDSYATCAASSGSRILEMYPPICVAPDGKHYTQPLPTDADIQPSNPPDSSYQCPQSGWVDCMPGPGEIKQQCTQEFLSWARANCPNFQGAAY